MLRPEGCNPAFGIIPYPHLANLRGQRRGRLVRLRRSIVSALFLLAVIGGNGLAQARELRLKRAPVVEEHRARAVRHARLAQQDCAEGQLRVGGLVATDYLINKYSQADQYVPQVRASCEFKYHGPCIELCTASVAFVA